MTKTDDPARLASIKAMVRGGIAADELEELSDDEVQDRFNIWLSVPKLKKTRLDGLTPTEQVRAVEQQGGVRHSTAQLIAKIIAAHPGTDVEYLKTKSIEYLTARVALIKEADREAGRQEEATARGEAASLTKKDSTMSLHLDAEARADRARADEAYERSKANLNANHPSMQRADSARVDAASPARGDSSLPGTRWKADAAEIRADAEAAEAAYQRSKANLNRRDR